jgi:hypothetical protein
MPEFDSRHQQHASFLAADGSSSRISDIVRASKKAGAKPAFSQEFYEDQYFAATGPPKV